MIKLSKHNLFRGSLVAFLGLAVFGGVSYLALFPAGEARATIYWHGGSATDQVFVPRLGGLGMRAVFGGPVTVNSNDGYYVIMEANRDVPMLLERLEDRFADLPPENVNIGRGTQGGFFTARMDRRMCAIMLIRDFNTNKTLLFTVMAPVSLFRNPVDPFMDQGGVDPVAELRPPGSTRVFCFETPALAFAAYKCMDSSLAGFYENILSSSEARGISLMSFTNAQLPDNGNLHFFERGIQNGFLAYQSSPKESCSYAIVCAQMQ